MSAKPSIPLRVSVPVYEMIDKIKTEKECTQMEATDILLAEVIETKKENEKLRKEKEEWEKTQRAILK